MGRSPMRLPMARLFHVLWKRERVSTRRFNAFPRHAADFLAGQEEVSGGLRARLSRSPFCGTLSISRTPGPHAAAVHLLGAAHKHPCTTPTRGNYAPKPPQRFAPRPECQARDKPRSAAEELPRHGG